MKKCPRCGGETRRSHSHGFFQKMVVRPLGIRPFRCRECGVRFFRFSLSAGKSPHTPQATGTGESSQPQKDAGHFTRMIADIKAKEGQLGLGKREGDRVDEWDRLDRRTLEEGLNRPTAKDPNGTGFSTPPPPPRRHQA